MRKKLAPLTVIAAFLMNAVHAEPVTLYDGSTPGLPADQGWIYLLDPLLRNNARQIPVNQGTNLNTLRNPDDHAGYFVRVPLFNPHPLVPDEFSRERGYQIGFTVQLPNENHIRPDRAGFSVIALSRDLLGIELGFWTNEIFAQSVDFIHSEGNANLPFNIANEYVDFVLEIQGDNYTLSSGDTEILTGPLRDYSGFGNPYNIPDFLFFGDDTTSASASVNIRSIWIDTELDGAAPPVIEPEPEPEPEPHPPVDGTEAIFTLDPEQSSLTVAGNALGSPFQAQGEGSLTTTFSGELQAALSANTITLLAGTRLDANESGTWSPNAGGANGSAPADYGVKATVLIAAADAAARNMVFSLSSDAIELQAEGTEFPSSGISISVPEDSSAAVDLAVGGFFPVNTSLPLAGLGGQNMSTAPATIVTEGNTQTISIPIQTDVFFRVVADDDALLTFTGSIVASRELPAEPEPPVVEPPLPPVVVEPDVPPTLSVARSGSQLQLSWDAVVGRNYVIESTVNFVDWQPVGDPIAPETEAGSATLDAGAAVGIYRVVLQAAE